VNLVIPFGREDLVKTGLDLNLYLLKKSPASHHPENCGQIDRHEYHINVVHYIGAPVLTYYLVIANKAVVQRKARS
jgi:hypothetical protein